MYFRVTVLSSELVVVACGRYKLQLVVLVYGTVALVLGKLMRNFNFVKTKKEVSRTPLRFRTPNHCCAGSLLNCFFLIALV